MASTKPRILIFIDWYLPGYKAGGPIKSVKNIVATFSSEYDFRIVTGDRDLGDDVPYRDITLNEWLQKDDYRIIYLTPDKQTKTTYTQLFHEISPKAVYLNSAFSCRFAILPLLAVRLSRLPIRVVLAPRGMLGQGAINIKKNKKTFFLLLCRWSGFFKRVIWHASSAGEEQDIKKNIGNRAQVRIAMNLSNAAPDSWVLKEKQAGAADLFFVSRISSKKNLLFALKCLSSVRANIKYFIIGTIEDPEYWQQCRSIISRLPENIKVEYSGHIENHKLHNIIRHYHFLLFPTLHENYGHVIAESIQAGCPVIISNYTPWRKLEEKGIGWDISLNNGKKFIETIEYCALMGQEEYNEMSHRVFDYAQEFINNPEIIEQNRKLFEF